MKKLKMELIEDWKSAWKWFSVQCMAIALALQEAWVYVPTDLKSHISNDLVDEIAKWLLVLGIMGRVLKQGEVDVSNTQDAGATVLAGSAASGSSGACVAKRAPQRKSGVHGKGSKGHHKAGRNRKGSK